jgi:hypothetical protein
MGVSELLGVEMTHGSSSLDEKQVTCRIPFLQYKTIHVIDLNQFPLRSATSGQTTFKAPPYHHQKHFERDLGFYMHIRPIYHRRCKMHQFVPFFY